MVLKQINEKLLVNSGWRFNRVEKLKRQEVLRMKTRYSS